MRCYTLSLERFPSELCKEARMPALGAALFTPAEGH